MVSFKDLNAIKRLLRSSVDARCFNAIPGCQAVEIRFNLQLTHETREHSSIYLLPRCLPEGSPCLPR